MSPNCRTAFLVNASRKRRSNYSIHLDSKRIHIGHITDRTGIHTHARMFVREQSRNLTQLRLKAISFPPPLKIPASFSAQSAMKSRVELSKKTRTRQRPAKLIYSQHNTRHLQPTNRRDPHGSTVPPNPACAPKIRDPFCIQYP